MCPFESFVWLYYCIISFYYIKRFFKTCLIILYAEYIRWNNHLDEAQAESKIAGRKINNLRYADDTTLMAESEKKLKSLLMKVKAGLKLNIKKIKIMAFGPIT